MAYGGAEKFYVLLANRHLCKRGPDGFEINARTKTLIADFIMHELTHTRQAMLIAEHGYKVSRGSHRDKGWFHAISEAAPRYLGVTFPQTQWPVQAARMTPERLSEVEVTHWPDSFRELIAAGDPRLPPIESPAQLP